MDKFTIFVKTPSRRWRMGRMTWTGQFSRVLCSLALAAILAQFGLPAAEADDGSTTLDATTTTALDTTTEGYIWSGDAVDTTATGNG
jgi:hypothetical protein